jgi:hypothetical protein
MDLKLRVAHTLFGHVDSGTFINALNSGENFVTTHKEWNRILVSKGRIRQRQLPGPLAYQKAKETFRTLLRAFVDEWIETGRMSDGMERPAGRGLSSGVPPKAFAAAARATKDLRIFFRNDGGLEIFFAPYIGHCGLPELAKREAARFFVWFLASDWRNTVVKCRKAKCGRYFTTKNIQHLFKRGTYCRNHSSEKSAAEITTDKRKKKHELLLQLAVTGFRRWHKETAKAKQERVLKDYVAEYVNKRTPEEMKLVAPKWPIKTKWITRNEEHLRRAGVSL